MAEDPNGFAGEAVGMGPEIDAAEMAPGAAHPPFHVLDSLILKRTKEHHSPRLGPD